MRKRKLSIISSSQLNITYSIDDMTIIDSEVPSTSAADANFLKRWDRFNAWVHSIAVVTFDLELGQALELIYPPHAKLTEKEKTNICYLAFPDSNSGCVGDTTYFIKTRRFSSKLLSRHQRQYSKAVPPVIQANSLYYYGCVYFRQVQDPSIPRGYFQKSVVILSQLPLHNLYIHVLKTIAPEFFEFGEAALESTCHDIDQWPLPEGGKTYNLPLLGSVIQCNIPSIVDPPSKRQPGIGSPARVSSFPALPVPLLLPSTYEPKLYEYLASLVPHLQLVWELILLNEPIIVMAPSPTMSSGIVSALISLIWPLRYACDERPYFTIHDSEFKEYTGNTNHIPSVILGVTNPFFTKTLNNWPHIIRYSDESTSKLTTSNVMLSQSSQSLTTDSFSPARTMSERSNSPLPTQKKRKDLKTLENKPGLYTKYKPLLSIDKAFAKKIVKAQRPAEAQSALLRRQFLEITQSFIIPLERYMASLMPLQKQISPYKVAPLPRPFDVEEFLQTLNVNGPALTTGIKGDWPTLYRRFIQTPNFDDWFSIRHREVVLKLNLLHLEVLCATNFLTNLKQSNVVEDESATLSDVELVDLMMKMCDKMKFIDKNPEHVRARLRTKLRDQLQLIFDSLTDDLKHVMLSNTQLNLRHILEISDEMAQAYAPSIVKL